MAKVTLDKDAFKALASDTRLEIIRNLDGKKMSLKDISNKIKLNTATLHEHLSKLHDAGLIKRKEREGHKWVYYKLSWKGACLWHPENTRIVIMFSTTLIALLSGIIGLYYYLKQIMSTKQNGNLMNELGTERINITYDVSNLKVNLIDQNPILQYIIVSSLIIFCILLILSLWRYSKNKIQKL